MSDLPEFFGFQYEGRTEGRERESLAADLLHQLTTSVVDSFSSQLPSCFPRLSIIGDNVGEKPVDVPVFVSADKPGDTKPTTKDLILSGDFNGLIKELQAAGTQAGKLLEDLNKDLAGTGFSLELDNGKLVITQSLLKGTASVKIDLADPSKIEGDWYGKKLTDDAARKLLDNFRKDIPAEIADRMVRSGDIEGLSRYLARLNETDRQKAIDSLNGLYKRLGKDIELVPYKLKDETGKEVHVIGIKVRENGKPDSVLLAEIGGAGRVRAQRYNPATNEYEKGHDVTATRDKVKKRFQ